MAAYTYESGCFLVISYVRILLSFPELLAYDKIHDIIVENEVKDHETCRASQSAL